MSLSSKKAKKGKEKTLPFGIDYKKGPRMRYIGLPYGTRL